MTTKNWFAPSTVTAVVIANMIGTGVFTSLGFQLVGIQSTPVLLILWILGGIIAFCGALCYAELGAALPRSGGEYNFLSQLIHPCAGFVSGWVSTTIGFAAPTALAAITFGKYLSAVFPQLPYIPLACMLVITLTFVHSLNRRSSGAMQNLFTLLKIGFIVVFCAISLWLIRKSGNLQPVEIIPGIDDFSIMTSSSFAVSLIYVSYAYTGWNAATYISSELKHPQQQLPRVLLIGTAVVTLLYVLLNYVFLRVAPMEAMVGKVEIGYVAASYVFGDFGTGLMGIAMAFMLISTVSAMIIAGPRVLQMIGEDFNFFKWLAVVNRSSIPSRAIICQSIVTLLFIITGTFDSILVFAGFTLGLNTFATVISLFILRLKQNNRTQCFRVWGFPLPPIVYLLLTGWTLSYILIQRPQEALFGLGVIVAGIITYFLLNTSRVFNP